VILRRFTEADAPALFALSQEAGIRAWIPDQVYDDEAHALRVAQYLIAQYGKSLPEAPFVLGVCVGDELVGHVGLSAAGDDIEIGYAIGDAHVGKGLATQAVRAMLAQAALPTVVGIVASDNAGSCRVLEKAGFTLSGETTRPLHGVTRSVRTYRYRTST